MTDHTHDTCPTCGSDKREVRRHDWMMVGDWNDRPMSHGGSRQCSDAWHDTAPPAPNGDEVAEALERMERFGVYEGTNDSITPDLATLTRALSPKEATRKPSRMDTLPPLKLGGVGETRPALSPTPPAEVDAALERLRLAAEGLRGWEHIDGTEAMDDEYHTRVAELDAEALATLRAHIADAERLNAELRAQDERREAAYLALCHDADAHMLEANTLRSDLAALQAIIDREGWDH